MTKARMMMSCSENELAVEMKRMDGGVFEGGGLDLDVVGGFGIGFGSSSSSAHVQKHPSIGHEPDHVTMPYEESLDSVLSSSAYTKPTRQETAAGKHRLIRRRKMTKSWEKIRRGRETAVGAVYV
jgi:hypothetical protein